jgi:hypothetical protein
MTRSKFSIKAALLAGGIGLSMAGFAGSQPAAAQSYSDGYACPAGSVHDTTYGCTSPGYAYDYGYLPYGGYGHDGDEHHEFGHGFGHGMGSGFDHGVGFAHAGGFGHGMAGGFHGGGGGHR